MKYRNSEIHAQKPFSSLRHTGCSSPLIHYVSHERCISLIHRFHGRLKGCRGVVRHNVEPGSIRFHQVSQILVNGQTVMPSLFCSERKWKFESDILQVFDSGSVSQNRYDRPFREHGARRRVFTDILAQRKDVWDPMRAVLVSDPTDKDSRVWDKAQDVQAHCIGEDTSDKSACFL